MQRRTCFIIWLAVNSFRGGWKRLQDVDPHIVLILIYVILYICIGTSVIFYNRNTFFFFVLRIHNVLKFKNDECVCTIYWRIMIDIRDVGFDPPNLYTLANNLLQTYRFRIIYQIMYASKVMYSWHILIKSRPFVGIIRGLFRIIFLKCTTIVLSC